MLDNGAIFPLFYLPSTEYLSAFLRHTGPLMIERFEHFPKQTYRNRASIASPNGRLDLTVPVVKGAKVHTPVKDVRISYEFNWQRIHWLSLQSSYRSSSWFEFYEDDFAPFYQKKPAFLFDYNEEIFHMLLRLLGVEKKYSCTTEYEPDPGDRTDYRESIHPKKTSDYQQRPYFQLFGDRTGFLPNLSVADLLFSQGPQSKSYL